MIEFIRVSPYILLFLGIFLVFISDSRLLKKKPIRVNQTIYKENKVFTHFKKLIYINFSKQNSVFVNVFIGLMIVLFLGTFYATIKNGFMYSIIVSTIMASIPYLGLVARRKYIRISVSYDAEIIITEIVNQYKIHSGNMIKALEGTIRNIDDTQISKKILTKLTVKIKEYSSESELQFAIDELVYSIDTEWSKMLANNLYLSINSGLDVTNSLEDIVKELVIAKSNFEKTDRLNTENFMIGKYLTPILYLGSVYLAIAFFDYTIAEFFYEQFKTSSGVNYFISIVFLTVININFMYYMKNRKFDF